MKFSIGLGGLTLCATVIWALLGAEGMDAPKAAERTSCKACMEVCQAPLSYDDSLLDDSTDRYLSEATRGVATAAAIGMAAKLKDIYREYRAGHFGGAYEAHAATIESLSKKQARDGADSAEIESLKRVRTALYTDAVVALQASAARPRSQRLAAALQARAAVLDGVIASMAARQQMRAAERLAVCEVLAAYKDE
jgi:hypothetical protein